MQGSGSRELKLKTTGLCQDTVKVVLMTLTYVVMDKVEITTVPQPDHDSQAGDPPSGDLCQFMAADRIPTDLD